MWNKCDLRKSEHDTVGGARQVHQSISETADLLRFSCTTIPKFYREWLGKEKIHSERQVSGSSCQERMTRLLWNNRRPTVTQTHVRKLLSSWHSKQSTVTRSQAKRALLECTETEDSYHVPATNLQELHGIITSTSLRNVSSTFLNLRHGELRHMKPNWGPTWD